MNKGLILGLGIISGSLLLAGSVGVVGSSTNKVNFSVNGKDWIGTSASTQTQLKEQLTKAEANVEKLQNRVEEIENALATSEENNVELQAELTATKSQLNEEQTKVASLNAQIDALMADSSLDDYCIAQNLMVVHYLNSEGIIENTLTFSSTDDLTAVLTPTTEPGHISQAFVGWSLSSDGEKLESIDFKTSSVVLYPVFEKIEGVNVTFKALFNQGSISTKEDYYTADNGYLSGDYTSAISQEYILKFLGWTTNPEISNNTDEIVDLSTYVPEEGTVFYAVYEASNSGAIASVERVRFTTFYSTNLDGSICSEQTFTTFEYQYNHLTTVAKSMQPSEVPDGYAFAGWSTVNGDASQIVDFTTTKITVGLPYYSIFGIETDVTVVGFNLKASDGLTTVASKNYSSDSFSIYTGISDIAVSLYAFEYLGLSLNADTNSVDDILPTDYVPNSGEVLYCVYMRTETGEITTAVHMMRVRYKLLKIDTNTEILSASRVIFDTEQEYLKNIMSESLTSDTVVSSTDGYTFIGWSTTTSKDDIVDLNTLELQHLATYYGLYEVSNATTFSVVEYVADNDSSSSASINCQYSDGTYSLQHSSSSFYTYWEGTASNLEYIGLSENLEATSEDDLVDLTTYIPEADSILYCVYKDERTGTIGTYSKISKVIISFVENGVSTSGTCYCAFTSDGVETVRQEMIEYVNRTITAGTYSAVSYSTSESMDDVIDVETAELSFGTTYYAIHE